VTRINLYGYELWLEMDDGQALVYRRSD